MGKAGLGRLIVFIVLGLVLGGILGEVLGLLGHLRPLLLGATEPSLDGVHQSHRMSLLEWVATLREGGRAGASRGTVACAGR